ncbi:hypothetical protein BXP70_12885 [Hymenobacter crusticola]|uniref:Adenosine deaminase n=2 Tax=Hymenobacter crusticola TaxID=1770526 RepID=A0A243WE30_9BACT|nr:hypothetical protein BXP70_12885 [Hymenobacter crusticola]
MAVKSLAPLKWFVYLFMVAGCSTSHLPNAATLRAPNNAYRPSQNAAAYERQRRALLAADSARAFNAAIVLSAEEQQANRKLIYLRQQLLGHYDSTHYFPPGRNFYRARNHMYATKLFQLLRKMPKGGIHHLHPNAGGSSWWIVQRALREPQCYVYWQPDNQQYVKGQIFFFRPREAPAGFYPTQILNDTVQNFPQKLHDLLTFDAAESQDSVDVWREFERCFQRLGGFTSYQPIFKDLYTATFDSLAADGVQHVELRTSLNGSLYDLQHPAGSFPADSIIRYFQQASQRIRAQRDPTFTFKLIYTNTRFRSLDIITADLRKAFELRKRYPSSVVAYDLVAHEDAGHTTDYFRKAWFTRDSLTRVYGIDMPLCLHDGESAWQHTNNLYDAALLNSTRIGHGFNLSFFPAAEELVRKNDICLEVSPLSNQILDYIGDLRMHPAHAWIKHGIQISISPDDPEIFDYVGVTPDYWSILLAWELDLRDLKKLALNGIEYSYLSAAEKKLALAAWQQKWKAFVAKINQEVALQNK